MGGRNPFLGIAYVVVGGLCIVLGAIFTVTHLIKPRYVSSPPRLLVVDRDIIAHKSKGNSATTPTSRGTTPPPTRRPPRASPLAARPVRASRPSPEGATSFGCETPLLFFFRFPRLFWFRTHGTLQKMNVLVCFSVVFVSLLIVSNWDVVSLPRSYFTVFAFLFVLFRVAFMFFVRFGYLLSEDAGSGQIEGWEGRGKGGGKNPDLLTKFACWEFFGQMQ